MGILTRAARGGQREGRQLKKVGEPREEGGAVREVLDLLEKARELLPPREKRPIVDPFKDLMDFMETSIDLTDIEPGMDLSDKEDVIEIVPSKGDDKEHICLFCNKTFDRVAKLSCHMKAAHTEAEKKPPKEAREESLGDDEWANMAGSSYQCLVCLASLPWSRSSLEQHLLGHRLSLAQYHGVFGPAIQRQLAKEAQAAKQEKDKDVARSKEAAKQEKDKKEVRIQEVARSEETRSRIQEVLRSEEVVVPESKEEPPAKPETPQSAGFKKNRNEKMFNCAVCKEEFAWTENNITEHLKDKHCLTKEFYFSLYVRGTKSTEDKFNCDKCLFVSTRKSALTFHVNKYHAEGEVRSCCKKKFKTKWELFVHLIENHRDDKEVFSKFDIWQSLEKYYLKPVAVV